VSETNYTERIKMNIELIAAAVTSMLAPFTPFLIETGKKAGLKLGEVIANKGGEAAWNKAQELWNKIKSHLGDDPKVRGAALMVSAEPENESSQVLLATTLVSRLKEHLDLAQDLSDLLGGQSAIQQVLANRKSFVTSVTQQIRGGGKQVVKADNNSRVTDVKQIKK
jgi:hypothetical protein